MKEELRETVVRMSRPRLICSMHVSCVTEIVRQHPYMTYDAVAHS